MDLSFKKYCPSCGAPLDLSEGDRLIDCEYCGVKNYMVINGALRFVLPDKIPVEIPDQDRFFIPYVRFKGTIFSHRGQTVDFKIMDTTYTGVGFDQFSKTLGLRAQAMQLQVLEGDGVKGKFLKKTEPLLTIFDRASLLTDYFSKNNQTKLLHRAFIGETISLIYMPIFRLGEKLYDGVLNRPISGNPEIFGDETNVCGYQKGWAPDFLAMLCPRCGDTMHGEKDSLVVHCRNCDSGWFEQGGSFVQVNWSAGRSGRESLPQLPFWKVTLQVSGVEIKSFGDFLRQTNQPLVIRPHYDEQSFSMFVPAFKVQPRMFLTLSKRFTVAQHALKQGDRKEYGRLHPVTLPLTEVVESIKTILVDSAVYKKKIAAGIKNISIKLMENELVYLPFVQNGNDLVQTQSNIAIPSATLHLGRKL